MLSLEKQDFHAVKCKSNNFRLMLLTFDDFITSVSKIKRVIILHFKTSWNIKTNKSRS